MNGLKVSIIHRYHCTGLSKITDIQLPNCGSISKQLPVHVAVTRGVSNHWDKYWNGMEWNNTEQQNNGMSIFFLQ